MHFVGDSHQPLHSETLVDSEYPAGDRGGNSVTLPSHYTAKNLHAVWDKVVYEFHVNPKTPFTDSVFQKFENDVDGLLERNPVSSLNDITNLDPKQWEAESFEIVSTFAYKGVHAGEALSAEYTKEGQLLAEKQLVTAGHRLANLLKTLKIKNLSIPSSDTLFLQE